MAHYLQLAPSQGDPTADVCSLPELNEASILKNIEERWRRRAPYTWIGSLLVSVNMFRSEPLPELTSDKARSRYRALEPSTAPPHVYAVAEAAVRGALAPPPDAWARKAAGDAAGRRADESATAAGGEAAGLRPPLLPGVIEDATVHGAGEGNDSTDDSKSANQLRQAILISGESGAGKTVAAQMLIDYIATRQPDGALGAPLTEPSEAHAQLSAVLKASGTLLDAFGNAKTTRNLNSSRYGRTVTLEMNRTGGLCRAVIRTYMLERQRVTGVHDPERNFHIFYALMHAQDADAIAPELPLVRLRLTKLKLTMPHSEVTYLNGSVHHDIKSELRGRGDKETLGDIFEALTGIGVSIERAISLLRFAGAVLLLGQIKFADYNKAFDVPSAGAGDSGGSPPKRDSSGPFGLGGLFGLGFGGGGGTPTVAVAPPTTATNETGSPAEQTSPSEMEYASDEGGAELKRGAAAAEALSTVCTVLGVDEQAFLACLTSVEVRGGKEGEETAMFTKRLTAERASKERDGVARALYLKLFEYLVRLLNVAMLSGDAPTPGEPPRARAVSIVDFCGFEMLRVNSFEQVNSGARTVRGSRLLGLAFYHALLTLHPSSLPPSPSPLPLTSFASTSPRSGCTR